jgi:hypothetical protein
MDIGPNLKEAIEVVAVHCIPCDRGGLLLDAQ